MNARRLVLAALCTMTGALVFSGAPAYAGYVPAGSFGSFSGPLGVAVDNSGGLSAGDVWVADTGNDRVVLFNPARAQVGEITGATITTADPLAKPFVSPSYVAVDPSNGDAYVSDPGSGTVTKFSSQGVYISQLGEGSFPAGAAHGSFSPYGVAVDPSTDDLYVADRANGMIDRFKATGEYETQFAAGQAGGFNSLAVNSTGNVYVSVAGEGIKVYNAAGVFQREIGSAKEQSVGIDPSNGVIFQNVFEFFFVVVGVSHFEELEPSGTATGTTFSPKRLPEPESPAFGLAVRATTHDVYASNSGSGVVEVFEFGVSPAPPVTERPTAVMATSAVLHGTANPGGGKVSYSFTYNTGANCTGGQSTPAGETGAAEEKVQAEVTGLQPNAQYTVCLVATNRFGSTTGSEASSTTLAGPARVSGTGATDITAGEATLHATIHPENEPAATYRFEYGPTAAYGTTVPAGEGHVGSLPSQVSQAITGLTPDTTYHFRVVASNGVGSPKTTADQTFTTYSSIPVLSVCPNEQDRKESDVNPETGVPFSLQLPECRAYEMVSPPLKNGAPLTDRGFTAIASDSTVARVGLEGSTVLIDSVGIWPSGVEQPANNDLLAAIGSEAVRYKVTRGESGWGFKSEVPPASDVRVYIPFIVSNGADMSPNGIWSGAGFAPTESTITESIVDGNSKGNLYLLEPDGALAEVGPSVPLSDRGATVEGRGSVEPGGASADLSRMLFSVPTFRWPFDQTEISPGSRSGYIIESLYEYIGTGHTGVGSDVPTLVGVDNVGTLISQCGTESGSSALTSEGGAISSGGSTVFFTARAAGAQCDETSSTGEGEGPLTNQVFARVGEPGPDTEVGNAVTVNVAGTSKCATASFDSCNVTKAVTYQGASADGSKVFFTSEQPGLVAGDTDSTNGLYECRLPGDSGAPLKPAAKVNPCPELIQVSAGSSAAGTPGSESANVQSVAAVSADGSHVYFIAAGVLTGENAEHNSPTLGKDNLYVWQEPSAVYPQGHTAFIATLPSASLAAVTEGEGSPQATPDGDAFVFTSAADLTPDDTSTVNQVFLYEAQHEALIRLSKGQNGFNDDGNTTTDPANIAAENKRRTISEDGSTVVFQSSDPLTTQVHGGTNNVYLWRGGNVYLISDGSPDNTSGREFAGLVGIDASGQNVFFTTDARLVGQDTDELSDLYDARVDGGFPAPRNDECVGEACQGVFGTPSGSLSPGSLSSNGQGNLTPAVKRTLSPKPLTRAQKLAKALKTCRGKAKKKRAQCETQAHKRYGATAKGKRKTKRKTGKSSGKGGK